MNVQRRGIATVGAPTWLRFIQETSGVAGEARQDRQRDLVGAWWRARRAVLTDGRDDAHHEHEADERPVAGARGRAPLGVTKVRAEEASQPATEQRERRAVQEVPRDPQQRRLRESPLWCRAHERWTGDARHQHDAGGDHEERQEDREEDGEDGIHCYSVGDGVR